MAEVPSQAAVLIRSCIMLQLPAANGVGDRRQGGRVRGGVVGGVGGASGGGRKGGHLAAGQG